MTCPPVVLAWLAQAPATRLWRSDGLLIWNRLPGQGVTAYLTTLTMAETASADAITVALLGMMATRLEAEAADLAQRASALETQALVAGATARDLRMEAAAIAQNHNRQPLQSH